MTGRLEHFRSGVNIGHWLSQWGDADPRTHFDTHITEADFDLMASWGIDHVRLPLNWRVVTSDTDPDSFDEAGLAHVDRALAWAFERGLAVVLDLHEAPGFAFTNADPSLWEATEKNDLFTSPDQQRRFRGLWTMFARRYAHHGSELVFELMNELLTDDCAPWNSLWQQTLADIRAIDPDRTVMIGGNLNADPAHLHELALVDDPGVVYTFHNYEPGLFTHQRVPFLPGLRDYPVPVSYPFGAADHQALFDAFAGQERVPGRYDGVRHFDKDFLRRVLAPAQEFLDRTGRELYCGEFGVYQAADEASTLRWFTDMIDLLDEMGVGRAVWSYEGFGRLTRGTAPRTVDAAAVVALLNREGPHHD